MSTLSKWTAIAIIAIAFNSSANGAEKASALLSSSDPALSIADAPSSNEPAACCALDKKSDETTLTPASETLVCSLIGTKLIERKGEIRTMLSSAAQGVEENEDGYTITFTDGYNSEIVEFIQLERECCPFFHFTLDFQPKDGPISLTISGPPGAKDFLSTMIASIANK